ncbi:MAG TPA: hypothetical protein VIP98_18125 [Microlunatus sp.]
MASRRVRTAGLAAGAMAAVAGTTVVAPPAHAYSNEWTMVTEVNTSTCASKGDRVARKVTGGCYLADSADNTFFQTDKGGTAIKVEVYTGTTLRGKLEFHPYSEKVWLYDTSNDGETIYADVWANGKQRIMATPGSSKKIEYDIEDLSVDEGNAVALEVYDGYSEWGGVDLISKKNGWA